MNTNLFLGVGFAVILSAPRDPSSLPSRTLAFDEVTMHLEVDLPYPVRSLIDMPTEVVLEVASPFALAHLRVVSPHGRVVFELERPDAVSTGLAEISLECEGNSLRDVLREFPPGEYRVQATTLKGLPVEGIARLSNRFPGLFAAVAPIDGEVVPEGDVTIEWTSSRGAARYVLEVEQEESGFTLEVALIPGETRFTVPAQLLRPGVTYEYSLAVQGDTDNELEVEGRFATASGSAGRAFGR
ncbi:MAG: hypothetical protein ACKVXR_04140 [Planctomycetota bacterium]